MKKKNHSCSHSVLLKCSLYSEHSLNSLLWQITSLAIWDSYYLNPTYREMTNKNLTVPLSELLSFKVLHTSAY